MCSRRAGKSHVAGEYLVKTCVDNPGVICVYIALTRLSAKRIMWRTLKDICHANGFYRDIKWNNTELTVEFPNGSQIILAGASDENDIEVLRGSKYKLVVVDECASFKSHFKEMVEEVIEPALIDLDGTLALIGTPGAACSGYFFDASTSTTSGYSKHHWTIFDNPFIPNSRGWLENRMVQKGWTRENPIYKREWQGLWVRSEDSLVYRFNRERNLYDGNYPKNMTYILGIDFGWNDDNAFCILGFNNESPNIYVCETFAKNKMLVDEISARIHTYKERYGGFARIVADTGGLGKQICEEIKARYKLNLLPAEKQGKAAFIEVINSDFAAKRILVPTTEKQFIEEMEILQWDDNEQKRMEDPRFANHLCDAFLYAAREAKHYLYKAPIAKPKVGSQQYFDAEEKKMFQKVQQSQNKQNQWWEE